MHIIGIMFPNIYEFWLHFIILVSRRLWLKRPICCSHFSSVWRYFLHVSCLERHVLKQRCRNRIGFYLIETHRLKLFGNQFVEVLYFSECQLSFRSFSNLTEINLRWWNSIYIFLLFGSEIPNILASRAWYWYKY